jgi:gamma-glutamyltranspeptidase/glutathione hydrolase
MGDSRPIVSSVHGIVAAAHPLAASAGARLLWQGGNAFDAAVATAAALGVVEPFMSGLAGNGMATVYTAREKRVRTLQFRAGVPRGFPVGRFTRREELQRGAMSVSGPGNLAGWCELVTSRGTRSLGEVFAPAIALARDGFPMTAYNAAGTNMAARGLAGQPSFDHWNDTYAGGYGEVAAGQMLRQEPLARTFEAIAAHGPGHLYGGALGQAIVRHVSELGGCLSMDDLIDAQAVWADATVASYRGLDVHVPPPPSQSFQFLLALRILEGFDLARMERNGVAHLDTMWRAVRLAAGERIRVGRPSAQAIAELLGDANVERLRARVMDGVPIDGPTEQWIAPPPGTQPGQHTTSLSVSDRWGNVVCITQSLGALYGSGVVVPGTGVCLNNALFWGELDPRGPNALVPGGALMSAVSPSIALRDGAPVLALGTPGSYGITQTQAQALVQHVDFGLGIQAAIEAPRARLWDGRRVQAEARFRPDVLAELGALGHAVEAPAEWTMAVGGMQGIALDPASGAMTGGADPRREGYVVPA